MEMALNSCGELGRAGAIPAHLRLASRWVNSCEAGPAFVLRSHMQRMGRRARGRGYGFRQGGHAVWVL